MDDFSDTIDKCALSATDGFLTFKNFSWAIVEKYDVNKFLLT